MVKYLRAANVKDGELDLNDVKAMNFSPEEQKLFQLLPGDVLITEGSGSLSTVGAAAVWRGQPNETMCFQNTVLRMRPRSDVSDGRFLGWWARSAYGSGAFASLAGGANIYHLGAERVRTMRIDLPPLGVQRRIADFLDAETARLDKLLEIRSAQQEAIHERAAAAVSDTLIPGILNVPLNKPPWPWLPSVDPDRPLVRLGYVSRLQSGLTVDGKRDVSGEVVTRPYLRVANVQAGLLELDTVTDVTVPRHLADRCTLRPHDVLMTEGGDLDKLGRGTVWRGELAGCLHQNHIFAIRPDPDLLVAEYLALMTQTVHGRCYFESTGSRTTNLASTSSYKIMGFPIPLPSVAEQRRAVERASRNIDQIDRAKTLLYKQRSLLVERRRALVTAAVTGEFDVSSASGRGVTE
jgi:type I restriction enzyme S subunit